jgi:hypothetical protein
MKDIVERIDEFFAPFMAGMQAGRKAKSSGGGGGKFGIMDDLFMEVIYHKNKNHKEAVEDVIKQKKLDKKMAKQLRKYVKQKMG